MRNKLLLICALALTIYSCGKSQTDKANGLATTAETKSKYNNTSFGVYKGVIVGSSGYIVFRINNGDDVVKGNLKIDGREDELTTTGKLIAGQKISNVLFTGSFSSMKLSADADGRNAHLTDIRIQGHSHVGAYITHENSNVPVMLYEGTFTGNASGMINYTKVGTAPADSIFTLMKMTGDTMLFTGYGYNSDQLNLEVWPYSTTMKFTGTKMPATGEQKSEGSWFLEGIKGGTFTIKRTY